MVARGQAGRNGDPVVASLPAGLFRAWRRLLSAAFASLASSASRSAAALRGAAPLSLAFLSDPARPRTATDLRTLAWVGTVCLAAGTAVSLVFARQLGEAPAVAALAVAWTLLWALVRLVAMLLAAPLRAPATRRIWAASLLPFLFGVTPALRLVALAVSARTAFLALQGSGAARPAARRAVGWAFGGQALAELLRWAATSVLFVVPLLGR